MKYLLAATLIAILSGCGSDDKNEHTELTDYKNKQLEKAKAVEDVINKRVDNLNQQLEDSGAKKEDDPR